MPVRKLKDWFLSHLWAISVCYFIFYLIAFFTLEQVLVPKYILHAPLDDLIPFCEWFVFPYCAWFAVIVLSLGYFLFKSREDYLRLCFLMFAGMTISLLIYVIAPTGLNLRVELTRNNIASWLVGLLQGVDTPTNVCPSIHVVVAVSVDMVVQRSKMLKKRTGIRIASFVLMVLICLSTVFIKQHSVIDVFWGVVLALVLLAVQFLYEHRKKRAADACPVEE